jgi:phage tail-like protein
VRGAIPDLPTPHPLVNQLPVVYLEHDFLGRFLGALDEVIAPVLLLLDNLPAHLAPGTAPADMLGWVGGWLAVAPAPDQPLERRRELVASAMSRHRRRGTAEGLAELIRQELGVRAEIDETGGVSWTTDPGERPRREPAAAVRVRIRVPDLDGFDRDRLTRLVAAEVPAHVAYDIEILPGGTP